MIGKSILELSRVDSTNGYANQLLNQGELDEGTVIWAHEQFAGRGQHDNHWISEAGKNLTFTVVIKPLFLAPDQQFLLNKAVALGVVDFVRNSLGVNSSPGISIKWPNDIYIHDKKAGGILIEHKIMGSVLVTSLAGIGININQTEFASHLPNPVSLIHLLREEMELREALLVLCGFIDQRYVTLRNSGSTNLDLDYHHCLLGFEQWRYFSCSGDRMEGKITGVDNIGRLLVESRTGEVLHFNHKEIEYVFDQ